MLDRGHERLPSSRDNNCVTVEMVILIHHGDWKRAIQNQLQTSEMVTITGRILARTRCTLIIQPTQLNEAATNAPLVYCRRTFLAVKVNNL